MRPELKLKKFETDHESTQRIYQMVRQTVDSFNVYVSDFYESVAILEEQHSRALSAGDRASASDAEEKISYMKKRIEELIDDMKRISAEMHTLVEYHDPHH